MIASKLSTAVLAAALAASSILAQCTFDWTAEDGEICVVIARHLVSSWTSLWRGIRLLDPTVTLASLPETLTVI